MIFRQLLIAKLHGFRVTECRLDYAGSITLDADLLEAAGLLEGELVQVVNNNNGERIWTYVIVGEKGRGEICMNGAAARRFVVGDQIIVMSFAQVTEDDWSSVKPNIVIGDEANHWSVANETDN